MFRRNESPLATNNWLVDKNVRVASDRAPGVDETAYSLLVDAAARAPKAVAITYLPSMGAEPIRLTHGALIARLHRMGRLFRKLGVGRDGVVTLLMPGVPDAVVGLWAAEAIGVAHPVNTLLRSEHIAAMMRAAGSRVLVGPGPQSDPDLWGKAMAAARVTPSLRAVVAVGDEADPGAGCVHLASSLPDDDGLLDEPPIPRDVAAIFHTGGTSGARDGHDADRPDLRCGGRCDRGPVTISHGARRRADERTGIGETRGHKRAFEQLRGYSSVAAHCARGSGDWLAAGKPDVLRSDG